MVIKRGISIIQKSEFLRNTILLIGGTTIAQILPFVFSPVISRLYTAEDFSVYGVFISIYAIMASVLSLRYDMAIMLPDENNKAKHIINLCLINSLFFTLLFSFVILFAGDFIVDVLNLQAIRIWLFLLPISALFLSINNTLINWYNRNKEYKTISINRISRNSILTAANIGFGYAKTGNFGLIFSQFISDGIAAIYYLWMYFYKVLNKKISINILAIKAVAKEFKDFPFFTLPTTFVDTVSLQIPVLLITSFFTSSLSGSYFFAYRILAIPIALVGSAYAQTFFQRFVSFLQSKNTLGARKFLYQSWLILLSLIIIPAIVVILFGEPIFTFIFGSEWQESGKIASILIFYIMFSFISSPTSSTYIALRMQKYSLIFGICVLCYRFSAYYIGYLFGDFYLALTILIICEIIEIIIYNTIVVFKLKSMDLKK